MERTTIDGNPLDDEMLRGAGFSWRWNFGDNSSAGLVADYAYRESGDINDDLRRLTIDYTVQVTPRLGVVFLAQQSRQKGNESLFTRYVENQLGIFLRGQL